MNKYIAAHEVRCSGGIIPAGEAIPALKQDEIRYLLTARAITLVYAEPEPELPTPEPEPVSEPVPEPELPTPELKPKKKNGGK